MPPFLTHFCTVCGREKTKQTWYLLAGNRWEDTLKILQWNDDLAAVSGVEGVCSTEHIRVLAAHWMKTGSLEYPFASNELFPQQQHPGAKPNRYVSADVPGARQVAELYIDRESMVRMLKENSKSAGFVLNELISSLPTSGEWKPSLTAPRSTVRLSTARQRL